MKAFASAKEVTLLDYGAGNIRSVRNAIKALGYTIKDVRPMHALHIMLAFMQCHRLHAAARLYRHSY